jgi:hypothetical protein
MPGSLNQFVLVSARKSRGGEWSPDDYDVRDSHGNERPAMVLDNNGA